MKLNIIGLIAAILAFITIVLPWWTMSVIGISFSFSLLDFANLAGIVSSVPGASAFDIWFVWAALALLAIGGLLGLVGSFLIGGKGKSLLAVGGILVILAPIIFAAGLAATGLPLFGSISSGGYDITFYISFGFFLALIAGILMLISLKKHPMEAEAVPLAPLAPPPQ